MKMKYTNFSNLLNVKILQYMRALGKFLSSLKRNMMSVITEVSKVDRVCVVQTDSVCARWTPIIAVLHPHHHH